MTPISRLIESDAKTPKRIAVIGDSLEDIYVHGVFGECQEDCYKFIEESRESVPGGSANAKRSVENWNARAMLFNQDYFEKPSMIPVKMRFIVHGKYVFRHDQDHRPSEDTLTDKRKRTLNVLKDVELHAILISDYDKGFLTPEFIKKIISFAKERSIPIVADAKRKPELYLGAIIKGNCSWKDKHIGNIHRPFVITNGDDYVDVWDDADNPDEPKSIGIITPVHCVNHVGAGDCFAAHLTLALAHGFSLEDAAAIAHSAGRVYVQWEHNRPPMPEEIRKDMEV